jgi:hypothetical protein
MQRLFTGYNFKLTPSFFTPFKKPIKGSKKRRKLFKWNSKKQIRKSMNFVFTHVKSLKKKEIMRKKLLKVMKKDAKT